MLNWNKKYNKIFRDIEEDSSEECVQLDSSEKSDKLVSEPSINLALDHVEVRKKVNSFKLAKAALNKSKVGHVVFIRFQSSARRLLAVKFHLRLLDVDHQHSFGLIPSANSQERAKSQAEKVIPGFGLVLNPRHVWFQLQLDPRLP
ncbi:hypothetical protein ACFE04_020652 [Oxalis oulophora]